MHAKRHVGREIRRKHDGIRVRKRRVLVEQLGTN